MYDAKTDAALSQCVEDRQHRDKSTPLLDVHVFEVRRRDPHVRARLQQSVDDDALMQGRPGQQSEAIWRGGWGRRVIQRIKTDSVWKPNTDTLAVALLVM